MKTEKQKILDYLIGGNSLNVFEARELGITQYLTQRAGELYSEGVRKIKEPFKRADGRMVWVTRAYMESE